MTRARRVELGFLGLLLVVFSVGGYLALGFPGQARWLPLGTSVPGGLLASWCLVRLWRTGPEAESEAAGSAAPAASHGFRHLMITLGLALPVAAVGGFLYAVPVCYLTFSLLSQGRDKLGMAIALSLASAGVTYVLFGRMLGVPLTRSIF